MELNWIIGVSIIPYFIGSIPFGLLLTRIFGMGDIRTIGSGNIGATNVLRTGRKGLAIATLLLDLLKGIVAVRFVQYIYDHDIAAMVAGLSVVLGHIFPVWLCFRGGKGVATTIGVLFALNYIVALIVCIVWFVVFQITGFSSLAAIISICFSPLIVYLLDVKDNNLLALLCLVIALVIIFTHRHNLVRLINGTELAFKKKDV